MSTPSTSPRMVSSLGFIMVRRAGRVAWDRVAVRRRRCAAQRGDGLGALMFAARAAEASTLCDSGASVYSEMQDAGPCPSPADSTVHNRADTLAGTNAEDARCHCENVRLIPPRS